MTINQLRRLIRFLPDSFVEEMNGKDFTTCWYASSGLDKRVMELLDYSHPDALIDQKVDVFFYNDIDFAFSAGELYFDCLKVDFEYGTFRGYSAGIMPGLGDLMCCDFQRSTKDFIRKNFFTNDGFRNWFNNKYNAKLFPHEVLEFHRRENWKNADDILNNSPIRNRLLSDLNLQAQYIWNHGMPSYEVYLQYYEPSVVLVKHRRVDGTFFYTFYLEIDDETLENLLIQKKLKVDFAAHWGGWAGPGPRWLGNLGCKYYFGAEPRKDVERVSPMEFVFKPYTMVRIKEFNWRPQDDKRILWKID